ncbi:hypothetical protein C8234_15595, partial [Paracidovorax avenae]
MAAQRLHRGRQRLPLPGVQPLALRGRQHGDALPGRIGQSVDHGGHGAGGHAVARGEARAQV